MLSLEQAQAAILSGIRPTSSIEVVPLAQARDRFVATSVTAGVDHPGFDNSAMDGYALRLADLPAHRQLPLAGEARAGRPPGELAPNTCMRIYTGAPLPFGADTVVIQEDVSVEDGIVQFPNDVRADANVRRRGEDFRAGAALYERGQRLRAYDVALLAAAGIAQVPVVARPRVLVVATGDELVAPGRALEPGQIYESNRLATLLQLERLGAAVEDGGIVADDLASLRALVERATDYDFIITSGGASVGDHDLVKQAFAASGDITFWKARIKPGKPIAFGHLGARTHFFALPGNPVSSLITYKLFVEPALYAWHHAVLDQRLLPAIAAHGFTRNPGRTEFLRARLRMDGDRLLAEPLKGQGSHMLGPLRDTTALIRVEAESAGFAAGDSLRVLLLE